MKTIFIGPIGGGKVPTNGASIKNFHILKRLTDNITGDFLVIDTENWNKRPDVLFKLLWTILLNRKAKYILSLNTVSANRLIRIIYKIAPNSDIIYWVIGGSFAKRVKNKEFSPLTYSHIKRIIVEGESMKNDLNDVGLTNVDVLPNFKIISKSYVKKEIPSLPIKFVFLSRIIPQKGCEFIIKAVTELNNEGYGDYFKVDFYGPIEESYRKDFMNAVDNTFNIEYKGFLDLRDSNNYLKLNKYDSMIFPTIWSGEGCPGVVIDSYIAGIPILASDWNLNKDYVKDNVTGLIFKANDTYALKDTMLKCILKPEILLKMYKNIPDTLKNFDIRTVLQTHNLKRLQILNN